MIDHPAAYWPPTLKKLSTRTRRCVIGAGVVTPFLLAGVLTSVHPFPEPAGPCGGPLMNHPAAAVAIPRKKG
jgi:hypothetical protein